MTRGIAVRDLDAAGGRQLAPNTSWFRVEGCEIVTKGDPVEGHGDGVHAVPVMVEGEDRFRVSRRPVSRAGHRASCGHVTSGRPWFRLGPQQPYPSCQEADNEEPFSVEHIPYIMRANGWHTGARLMNQWFNRPASTDRDSVSADVTTVKLDWVLSFNWARDIYDVAIASRVWTRPAAITEIRNMLVANNKFKEWETNFGEFEGNIHQFHKNHIQYEPVTPPSWMYVNPGSWDDLIAAFAKFTIYFVVSGRVRPNETGYVVEIDRVGVYVRDSYDFEGSQFLGFWKWPDRVGILPVGCQVNNSSFREWREINNMGGDYYIYSDMRIIQDREEFFVGPAPEYQIRFPQPLP